MRHFDARRFANAKDASEQLRCLSCLVRILVIVGGFRFIDL